MKATYNVNSRLERTENKPFEQRTFRSILETQLMLFSWCGLDIIHETPFVSSGEITGVSIKNVQCALLQKESMLVLGIL